jgi:hypothetical protein
MQKNNTKEHEMKKYSTVIYLAFICFIIASFTSAARADSTNCLICHNPMGGKITLPSGVEIDLRVDADKFGASVHGFLQCTECHKKFDEDPHVKPSAKVPLDIESLAEKIGVKAKIDPVAYAACVTCHGEIYAHVVASVHGQNIVKKHQSDGALCLDCHGSPHYIVKADNPESKVNKFQIVETCGKCHGNEELEKKYNIEYDVMGTYRESFHGRKHHLGHTKAPTCASCHGAHDIKSASDPTSPVYGDNRIKTCGKCHKGANKKFISGISHKPAGPIPHYAEKGLIILTLSVFAFIVAHVFLDAFSDIRDAIFRRRRTGKDESKEN